MADGEEIRDLECRLRCRDGGYRWVLRSAVALPDRQLIYATGRDITRRKEAEEEQRQRLLLEGVHRAAAGEFALGGRRLYTGVLRDITQRHQAEAAILQAEVGKGSVFHFTACFGCHQRQLAPAVQAAPAQGQVTPPVPGARLRMLVVEDTPFNQLVARGYLQQAGHQVEVAADGRQALERIAAEVFDAVLMDVQMPELDGYETTRAIRRLEGARGGHLTIIGLSARTAPEDRQRCLEAGMDSYLAKPINRAQLLAALAALSGSRPANLPGENAAVTADAVLDPAVLANLQEWQREGYLSLAEFAQVFAEDGWRRLAALRQATSGGEAERIKREAHALKGAGRELGAARLAGLCQKVEELGAAGALAEVAVLLEEAEAEMGRVKEVLDRLQRQPR